MAANGIPKPLKVGDKVVFMVRSEHAEYSVVDDKYRDTWLEGTLGQDIYSIKSQLIRHPAFMLGCVVWYKDSDFNSMVVIRKVGNKLHRTGHIYKPSQVDKTLVIKSLRNK